MDAAVVVLATADEDRRAPVLRELTRAGFAVLTEASWEGLTRQVSQPGRGLALLFLGAVQITALTRRTGAAPGADHALTTLHLLIQPTKPQESL